MIRACALGSGSKGNSIYVEVDGVAFLLDAGIPCRSLEARLADIDRQLANIKFIFISHQHGDHVSALPIILKKTSGVSVFSEKEGTLVDGDTFSYFGVKVTPFRLSHDEACMGCVVEDADGNKLCFVPDTGCIPEEAFQYMFDSSIVFFEFNHDTTMLTESKYPVELQERVFSDLGHMRNSESREIIKLLAWDGLKYLVPIHLSVPNNSRKLVQYEAEVAVKDTGCSVILSTQTEPTKFFTIM